MEFSREGAELEVVAPNELDYYRLLAAKTFTAEDELYARSRAWQSGNDLYRKDDQAEPIWTPVQEQNLRRLVKLADDSNLNQRLMKAEALRELGNFKECLELLVDTAKIKDGALSARVIRNLAILGVRRVHVVGAKPRPPPKDPPDEAEEMEKLKSADVNVRCGAANAFTRMNLSHAPAQLVEMLMSDPSVEVRAWVAYALSVIKDRDTIPRLIQFAGDKSQDQYGRRNAVRALGDMRAIEATDMLERLARQAEDEGLAYGAAVAWSKITRTRHPRLSRSEELESDREYPDGRTPWSFEKHFKEMQLQDTSLFIARPVSEKSVMLIHMEMDQQGLREALPKILPEPALGRTESNQSREPAPSSN